MLKIEFHTKFKKDRKNAISRGLDDNLLKKVVQLLAEGEELPDKNKDHKLVNSRNYINARECHMQPDWLLIYAVDEDRLILELIRTGSHSDLFK